jgi:glycosyltransferase 2 family protein
MENKSDNTIENNNIDLPELKKKKITLKNVLLFILRIGIAVAIIYWMIAKSYEQLVKALEGFNYIWLIPAVLLYAIHLLAGGLRWYLLLRVQKIQIKYHEALSLTMQGFFFSLVLPGGALGGDVVKGAFLVKRTPKGNKLTGTFTILIDRIIGMISLFSLAGVAGLLSYQFLKNVSGFMELIVYALLFGCTIGICSAIVLFFHRQLEKIPGITQILGFGDKLTHGAVSKLTEAMDSFRNSWKTLLSTMLISVVLIHLMLSLVVYCIAGGLRVGKLRPEIYVLSTTLANAAAAIPATPAGVGTRDVVLEKIFVSAGVSAGDGVAIALIFTSMILIFNLSGGIFFILYKSKKREDESS